MKVITITNNAIAINPQQVISFGSNQVFESEVNGVTEENLHRMIELGFAKKFNEDEKESGKIEESIELESELKSDPDVALKYEFEAITDKDELALYALDIYEVELDKRKSLANMIEVLKAEIEKEGDK